MGADRGVHIELPESAPLPEPLGVARALRALVARQNADLVIMGKQAIDDDMGQTGQMLAALLGAAQATCASALEVDVERRAGLRIVGGRLPDRRLGEGRQGAQQRAEHSDCKSACRHGRLLPSEAA